ncbi:MAG: hypothetical protein M0R74_12910 [Dehalococcoidia bacterium]|jgi:hypothetical protein|nr:hypothetical protein [Dehalococcoidia bacterium]
MALHQYEFVGPGVYQSLVQHGFIMDIEAERESSYGEAMKGVSFRELIAPRPIRYGSPSAIRYHTLILR